MLPSHNSCLTANVRGPAVNFCDACAISHSFLVGESVKNSDDYCTICSCAKNANIAVSGARPKRTSADRLVMRLPPLGLLRGGMHVAEAALERAFVEDGRRAGAVIERVDDL